MSWCLQLLGIGCYQASDMSVCDVGRLMSWCLQLLGIGCYQEVVNRMHKSTGLWPTAMPTSYFRSYDLDLTRWPWYMNVRCTIWKMYLCTINELSRSMISKVVIVWQTDRWDQTHDNQLWTRTSTTASPAYHRRTDRHARPRLIQYNLFRQ